MSRQNALLSQLFSQQEELKRLEEKQRQLVEMKRVAEGRLAAANKYGVHTPRSSL